MKLPVLLLFFSKVLSPLLSAQCPEGHSVALPNGSTSVSFCQGQADGNVLVLSDIKGFPKAYVLTTSRGEIIWVGNHPRVSLSGLTSGVYRIYALVYAGRLQETVGQNIDEARMSSFCWTFSVNYIEIVIAEPDQVDLAFADGSQQKSLCSAPGDLVDFTVTTTANESVVVAVDENNEIVAWSDGESLPLNLFEDGDYIVYAIAYEGSFTGEIGDMYIPAEIVQGCYSESDPVGLSLVSSDGGSISHTGGQSDRWICPGADPISIEIESGSGLPYFLIAVDEENVIRIIEESADLDFSGLAEGNYRIMGFSASDQIAASVGDTLDIDQVFDGGCSDQSANELTLRHELPHAGSVTFSDFAEEILYFCPGSVPDSLYVEKEADADENFIFVTTTQDGEILGINTDGLLEGILDSGMTVISGLSYRGQLLVGIGDNLLLDEISDECYTKSQNSLSIVIDQPDGAEIDWTDASDTLSFCSGDGRDVVELMGNSSASDLPYFYIVLDEDDVVIRVFDTDSVNFEGIKGGVHRIVGLSAANADFLMEGETFDPQSDDCYSISNNELFLDVFEIDGGEIFLSAGRMEITTCAQTGQERKVRLFRNTFSPVYQFVLVDSDGELLRITFSDSLDLGDLEANSYKIFGLGSEFPVTAQPGDNIFDDDLGGGCYALSEEYIEVKVDTAEGGLIEVHGIDSTLRFCAGHLTGQNLSLSTNSGSSLNYRYLLMDEDNLLLEVISGDSISTQGLDGGNYRIRGVSYGGTFLLSPGDVVDDSISAVATECHDFSQNTVYLEILEPDGGEIAFFNGETSLTLCTDTAFQKAEFQIVVPGRGDFFFAILDPSGVVVDTFTDLQYDFSELDIAFYTIAGVAHSGPGEITTGLGLDSMLAGLSCYRLSNGILHLTFATPDGGLVFDEDGNSEIDLEIGQNEPGIVKLENSSDSSANYIYAVTDSNDVIFFLLDADELSVFTALFGELRIYGISYTGNLLLSNGQNVFQPASDGCYELSSNFLRITLIDADDLDDIPDPELSIRLTGPNPVSDLLHFQVEVEPLSAQQIEWKILSFTGNVEAEGVFPVSMKTEEFQLDVSTFQPGIYYLVIRYDGMGEVLKFVKH